MAERESMLPDTFRRNFRRPRSFRTDAGWVTATLDEDSLRIDPGGWQLGFDDLESALVTMRRGEFVIERTGPSPVVAAILLSLLPRSATSRDRTGDSEPRARGARQAHDRSAASAPQDRRWWIGFVERTG